MEEEKSVKEVKVIKTSKTIKVEKEKEKQKDDVIVEEKNEKKPANGNTKNP